MRATCANLSVRAFEFGPGLFEKDDPYLSACGFTEDGAVGGIEDGYIIINDNLGGYSSFDDYEFIDS